MPTYEYVCEKCGHQFDLFQSMSAKPLTECPKDQCAQKRWGRGRVKKQITAGAGLLFKGSGFYITDYRSEGYQAAAKKENTSATSSGDSKGTSAASGSGDSKPAAKTQPAADKSAKPAKSGKPSKPSS